MRPGQIIFLLFLSISVLEIYLLIQVGSEIGGVMTVILILLTAMAGSHLVRTQGLSTLAKVQRASASGELPAIAMFEGVAILIAGILLVTPGFFTDSLGFILLVPAFRRGILAAVMRKGLSVMMKQNAGFAHSQPGAETRSETRVFEGKFRRED
jgi:UPF0716 protein FxsA